MVCGAVLDVREIPVDKIIPHEKTEKEKVFFLVADIKRRGLQNPIIVSPLGEKYLLLDGHHRFEATKILGIKRILAIIVDYNDKNIVVKSWRNESNIDKRSVINAALTRKFPPKTTKHMIRVEDNLCHISTHIVNPEAVINDLKKMGFEKTWEKYSNLIPKDGKVNIPRRRGKEHLLIETLFKIREALLELGFEEVVNPVFINEQDVYKQYGPEAPVILDRIFYLAGLPRPDIGISREIEEKLQEFLDEFKVNELKKIFREYRKGQIDADELIEVIKSRLGINDNNALRILGLFEDFFRMKPIPTNLTLRSHMTAAWFLTIREILEYRDPPLYLFSIDWVFRREQRVDEEHLKYYHSVSTVVVDPELNEKYAFELTKKILEKIQKKLGVRFDIKIVKRKDTARYYAKNKEWEVYVKFGKKYYEIGTFGFYNPISLAKYGIPYWVYNFGMGLERLAQIISNERDIRKVIFSHRYVDDRKISESIRIKEPVTKWGKRLHNTLLQKIEEYKDKKGPFEELVYKDEKVKVYFIEKDKGKKFLGPAAFNKIYIKDLEIVSTTGDLNGIFLGRYIDLILKGIVHEVESGKRGEFSVKWVNGPKDVNIEIPKKMLKYIKRINIKGPVFFDIKVI